MSRSRHNGAHDHWEGEAAAYALGALDRDERHRFEEHLAICAQCREQLAMMQRAVDETLDSVFVTTGNPDPGGTEPGDSFSVVRLTTSAAASCSINRSESLETSDVSGLSAWSMISVTVTAKQPSRWLPQRSETRSLMRREFASVRYHLHLTA